MSKSVQNKFHRNGITLYSNKLLKLGIKLKFSYFSKRLIYSILKTNLNKYNSMRFSFLLFCFLTNFIYSQSKHVCKFSEGTQALKRDKYSLPNKQIKNIKSIYINQITAAKSNKKTIISFVFKYLNPIVNPIISYANITAELCDSND